MAQQEFRKQAGAVTRNALPGQNYLRITLIQLAVTGCLLVPVFLAAGTPATVSLASGALCALVPQAFFALRMQMAARVSAQRAARLGLAAEGGKFLLSAVAFALVFAFLKPARPGLVFLGFALLWAVQVVYGIRLLHAVSRNDVRR